MSLTNSTHSKITLWIWPTGLFPRRVLYYFRAKGITMSTLEQHNIHLVPIVLDSTGLVSLSGHEARPADCSLPVLRIQHDDGHEFWIHEAIAILEYFEELFPCGRMYKSLRGATVEQRARTRDILNLLSDGLLWSLVKLIHTNPLTHAWSGLKAEHMSTPVAEHANKKFHSLLSRLETWVENNVIAEGTSSLSGQGGQVTLADIVLLAQVEYLQMMYGMDWVAEHGALRVWCERAKATKWYIASEELKRVENGEKWEVVLGK